jgi:hypothetical protein
MAYQFGTLSIGKRSDPEKILRTLHERGTPAFFWAGLYGEIGEIWKKETEYSFLQMKKGGNWGYPRVFRKMVLKVLILCAIIECRMLERSTSASFHLQKARIRRAYQIQSIPLAAS